MTPHDAAGTGAARFVSRGGDKLQAAIERFGVDVGGKRALDAGASTGGFTDCLLANGAAEVVAADVAYGILAWTLRNDDRVRVLERTNVRTLDAGSTGGKVDLVVADLAFISLRTVRDALLAVCKEHATLLLLVKPQFEAPKAHVARGGVVRDAGVWRSTMHSVADAYRDSGCTVLGACASPLTGPAGNREFFLYLQSPPSVEAAAAPDEVFDTAIAEAP
ncbi:MAG: TlyA family RNA methyltransferase [Actinomycetota bacterium]|nr:TlyA family RNA methyltransferase [Actinomycetota bacterium]